MTYWLMVIDANGATQTIAFETPVARALAMITLSSQPVTLRMQDA
jgi:hypothetical protein